MTGRPVIGITLALLVESFHWLKIRWDFDADACALAWKLTTIAITFSGVLIFLDGSPYQAMPSLFTWLPVLLLPMQFVQGMGMKDSMPLITFSFLAKHRLARNLRLGLTEEMIHINFGNIYFVAILVASTLGGRSNSWPFLPGMIMLTGWMLLSATRSRPFSLLVALTIAGGIAVAGQFGLEELNHRLGNRGASRSTFDPDSNDTMIGRNDVVRLSPEIVWRLRPTDGTSPPRLLRKAGYNTYSASSWIISPLEDRRFKDLDIVTSEGKPSYILEQYTDSTDPLKAVEGSLPRFTMRGSAFADTPLPLPGNADSLGDFELDGIEHNALGTVIVAPKQSVIEGTVLWKGETRTENRPTEEDLAVPHLEHDTLRAVIKELKLDEQTTLDGKLKVIHSWFLTNFNYTLDLKIQSSRQVSRRPTAITQFLTTKREGHCEYFASASVLLLREAGIPARYAIGYAVSERDLKRNEYVIRGTHGHAWCRVWDLENQRWLDFDTTPPSWLPTVARLNPAMQPFNDALKRMREDFFLWRNRPANRLGVSLVMSAIALGVLGFVFKRLWKSKQRLQELRISNGYEGSIERTPLNALERQVEKRIGPRPPGQPFGQWISNLKPEFPEGELLDEAVELHQRLRFDPAPKDIADQTRLIELASQLESALKRI